MPGKAGLGQRDAHVPPVDRDAGDQTTIPVNALYRDLHRLAEDQRTGEARRRPAKWLPALRRVDALEANPESLAGRCCDVERVPIDNMPNSPHEGHGPRRNSTHVGLTAPETFFCT